MWSTPFLRRRRPRSQYRCRAQCRASCLQWLWPVGLAIISSSLESPLSASSDCPQNRRRTGIHRLRVARSIDVRHLDLVHRARERASRAAPSLQCLRLRPRCRSDAAGEDWRRHAAHLALDAAPHRPRHSSQHHRRCTSLASYSVGLGPTNFGETFGLPLMD